MFRSSDRTKRAKTAQLTVRLDEQLKKRAELRLDVMGITATDAVEQLYRYIAEHGRMPLATRVVTTDDPFTAVFSQGEVMSFRPEQMYGDDPSDNVVRLPQGAAFAASGSLSAGSKESLADGDVTGFIRRFLTFLAARGVSCSDIPVFTAEVCQHERREGILRAIRLVMSQKGMSHAQFFLHNETPAELPHFAASLPDELTVEFGFTSGEAGKVLNSIRPARELPQ
ncbi:type II toxin-antitoxin system RelB/DinJ family antitoxin [Pantoea agglomerans]|uniref:type II toxin-antitoxin system RelB/DinJ family antitoxin n=1 Tax=Enterobacter agglomerans TaxID=549 RepID=UPI00320AEF55